MLYKGSIKNHELYLSRSVNTCKQFVRFKNFIFRSESGRIMTAALMRGLSSSMYGNNSYMVLFATFVTYYFYGDGITMGKVYFAMSLFFVIRMALVLFFPLALQMMTEFHGSCKRIEVSCPEVCSGSCKTSMAVLFCRNSF